MKKKTNRKRIIVLIIVIVLILIGYFVFDLLKNNDKEKNVKIIATKIVTEDEQEENITYTIEIEDNLIQVIEKTIEYETEQKAKLEYNRYETINEYELRGLQLELKNKKLIIIMTENQFFQDIEYNEEDNIILISKDGEQKEIINQEKVKELLQKQEYIVK